MTEPGCADAPSCPLACSNLEDLLGCLGLLRLTARPQAGLAHLPCRPVAWGPLTRTDCEVLQGGASYNFPVLVRLDPADAPPAQASLARSVPLDRIRALVFRTEAERDRVIHALAADICTSDLVAQVEPALFMSPGPDRIDPASLAIPAGAEEPSDAIAGAVLGLLLATARRADCQRAAFAMVHPNAAGRMPDVLDALMHPSPKQRDDAETGALRAAFRALLPLSGQTGADAVAVAESFARHLSEGAGQEALAGTWKRRADELLSYVRFLAPADVQDPAPGFRGSAVLRAMTLLLFRESPADVLEAPVGDVPSGPAVTVLACLLAGMREGLGRAEARHKTRWRALLGELAAALDSHGPAVLGRHADLLFPSTPPVPIPAAKVPDMQAARAAVQAAEGTPEEGLLARVARILREAGLEVRPGQDGLAVSDGAVLLHVGCPGPRAAPADAALPAAASTEPPPAGPARKKRAASSRMTTGADGVASPEASPAAPVEGKPARKTRAKAPADTPEGTEAAPSPARRRRKPAADTLETPPGPASDPVR